MESVKAKLVTLLSMSVTQALRSGHYTMYMRFPITGAPAVLTAKFCDIRNAKLCGYCEVLGNTRTWLPNTVGFWKPRTLRSARIVRTLEEADC